MKTWSHPTANTNILPYTISPKHIMKVVFVFFLGNVDFGFPMEGRFLKMMRKDLVKKSRPPDCGITFISSCEYVLLYFQHTEWQDCIESDKQNLKTIQNP